MQKRKFQRGHDKIQEKGVDWYPQHGGTIFFFCWKSSKRTEENNLTKVKPATLHTIPISGNKKNSQTTHLILKWSGR